MNTMILGAFWTQASAQLARRLVVVLGLMLLALMIVSPNILSAYAGLGGYISEKLLGDGVVPDASLYLGDSASGPAVIRSGPIVSTLSATNIISEGGVASATLRGNLSDLNGMPGADVWWVWGYNAGAMGNTTAVSTVTSTGEQAINISGMNIGVDIYFQFQSSTDGTAIGATQSFLSGGAHGASYALMRNILPLIIAVSLFIFIIKMTGNPVAALFGAVIGLMAFIIVQQMLGIL